MESSNRENAPVSLGAVEAFARSKHACAPPCHDFSHVERVRLLALRLAAEEGADLFIVECAALLHDVGRVSEGSGYDDDHERESARLAAPFLGSLGFSPSDSSAILHAILAHRHRKGAEPETPEAKCLYDADKLDSLGAVGVARAYLWLGEHGRGVYYPEEEWRSVDPGDNRAETDSFQREWHIKLKDIPSRLHTKSGRRIAEVRAERTERVLREVESEARGES